MLMALPYPLGSFQTLFKTEFGSNVALFNIAQVGILDNLFFYTGL